MLSDPAWTEALSAMEFEKITPEQHPGNYIVAVIYYAVWLLLQAIFSLIGALASCCCMNKKKIKEGVEQPAPPVMWGARAVLGLLLLATIFMANSMELFGNRKLNQSMHNSIHSVEGLFNYADDWMKVGNDFLDVGDSIYAQVAIVNNTIFSNANPGELQAAATCLQDIGSTCSEPSFDTLMDDYFAWAGQGAGPDGEGADRSFGKCETSGYTEGEDYVLGSTLAATPNVILDAVPTGLGQCVTFCLVGQPLCTGAQWIITDSGSGESDCVLWLGDSCKTATPAEGYVAGDAAAYALDDTLPIDVVYKRVYTSAPPNDQTDCVDKTATTVEKINDNVMELPAEIMDIINVMDTMMDNQVTLCLLPVAGPLGDGLAGLVPTIQDLQDSLGDIMLQIREGIQGGREAIDAADDGYEHFKAPPPPGDWGMSITEDGQPYPLEYDELGNPVGEHKCLALSCIDNELDYYDENRGGHLPIARTDLFTIFGTMATLGSLIGIGGLATNNTKLWKLMCFLFFFWGPASLILSGVTHPPMIFASDACQDIEEVAIDVALAQNPDWDSDSPIVLMTGEEIMAQVNALPNFNYTGDPIADVSISDMRGFIRYYFLDNCVGEVGTPVANALNSLESIMIDVVVGMATDAGDMVEDMLSQMEGVTLRQGVIDEVLAVTSIVEQDVPPVIRYAFSMVRCERISKAYYEVKSPICCDVVVAMYWVAYPLSVMGFCTLAAMFLTIFLGSKAFPGEQKAGGAEFENPAFDKD